MSSHCLLPPDQNCPKCSRWMLEKHGFRAQIIQFWIRTALLHKSASSVRKSKERPWPLSRIRVHVKKSITAEAINQSINQSINSCIASHDMFIPDVQPNSCATTSGVARVWRLLCNTSSSWQVGACREHTDLDKEEV